MKTKGLFLFRKNPLFKFVFTSYLQTQILHYFKIHSLQSKYFTHREERILIFLRNMHQWKLKMKMNKLKILSFSKHVSIILPAMLLSNNDSNYCSKSEVYIWEVSPCRTRSVLELRCYLEEREISVAEIYSRARIILRVWVPRWFARLLSGILRSTNFEHLLVSV